MSESTPSASGPQAWPRLALPLLAAAAVLAGYLGVATRAEANPDPVTVTVTITRFFQTEDPDDGPAESPGDYYAKVKIGDFPYESTFEQHVDQAGDISPNWSFNRTVDSSAINVPVVIEIWDHDDTSPDDEMDISPSGRALDLSVELNTSVFRGDIEGIAKGESEGTEEDRGKVFFTISTSLSGDTDGDGIPDGAELDGFRDASGTVFTDMAAMGADPCRKTIAVEIDYMSGAADGHTHQPQAAAVTDAIAAFDAAPVNTVAPCPYAGFPKKPLGINFIVDVSNSIPEQAVHGIGDDFTTTRKDNFTPGRRPFFHYGLFVHDKAAGSSSSGHCCNDGKDFVVSLGSWRQACVRAGSNGILDTTATGDDVVVSTTIRDGFNRTCDSTAAGDDTQVKPVGSGLTVSQVGTFRDQSGSILHELGHALGIGHGGHEGTNYKPNYLSVMNYLFDPGGIPDPTLPANNVDSDGDGTLDTKARLDYSRSALPTLVETALQEPAGIGDGTDATGWFDLTYTRQSGVGNGPLDWTGNNFDSSGTASDDGPVNVDINKDGDCVSAGANNTLETTSNADDVVIGSAIKNGPDHACDTAPSPSTDDVRDVDQNEPCVGFGANGVSNSALGGDDIVVTDDAANPTHIGVGSNLMCETTSAPDDIQIAPIGQTEPGPLVGSEDWQNINYRAALSPDAAAAPPAHPEDDITFEEALENELFFAAFFDPDLETTKSVDKTDADVGDTLHYTVAVENVGTGTATSIVLVDTLPDGSTETRALSDLAPGETATETFTYLAPCATPDLTVLTNSATVSALDLMHNPEDDTSNNTSSVSTTVHAPVLTIAKAATASVNAGEAITYTVTYENTGSGAATNVVITDRLPAGVYYSTALDLGGGPQPSSVTMNPDGSRTLIWNVGTVPASSGLLTITYTARPWLLALPGESFANDLSLEYQNANGCVFPTLEASASTAITAVPPTRDPRGLGFWRTHSALATPEMRARVQATDQRFDGDDGSAPDGALSAGEAAAALAPGGNMDDILEKQLLATYLNLATRRINAGTAIESKITEKLGLANVRDAVVYATETLALPVSSATRERYSDATLVLDEINANASESY